MDQRKTRKCGEVIRGTRTEENKTEGKENLLAHILREIVPWEY